MKLTFCFFGETFKGRGLGVLIYWGKEATDVGGGYCYVNSKWLGIEWAVN